MISNNTASYIHLLELLLYFEIDVGFSRNGRIISLKLRRSRFLGSEDVDDSADVEAVGSMLTVSSSCMFCGFTLCFPPISIKNLKEFLIMNKQLPMMECISS